MTISFILRTSFSYFLKKNSSINKLEKECILQYSFYVTARGLLCTLPHNKINSTTGSFFYLWSCFKHVLVAFAWFWYNLTTVFNQTQQMHLVMGIKLTNESKHQAPLKVVMSPATTLCAPLTPFASFQTIISRKLWQLLLNIQKDYQYVISGD